VDPRKPSNRAMASSEKIPRQARPLVWLKLSALLLLLGASVLVAVIGWSKDPAGIHQWVSRSGSTGRVVFVAAYVAFTLLALPKGLLSAASGAAFGLGWGVTLSLTGATLGATAAFFLARWLGRDAVVTLTRGHVDRLEEVTKRRGTVGVLLLRLIPVVPFTALNYAAGVSALRYRQYLLGSVVGMLPGTFAYVALGAYGRRPASVEFISAVVAFVVLILAGTLAVLRLRRNGLSHGQQGGT
jgi:uncharacterized membrane protein YdjX (TVP38/TMEM64 family)